MSSIDPINPGDPINSGHPEEMLEAYVLDALDDEEASQVESHLETCAQCRQIYVVLQQTAARLGQAVSQSSPPASLLPRVMQALPSQSVFPSGTDPPRPLAVHRFTAAKLLLPLAAVLFLALFSISMAMSLQASGRMDRMEEASANLAVQLGQTMAETKLLEEANTTMAAQLDQAMAETKRMGEENALLVEQLNRMPPDESGLMDTVQQIRAASFLMAHPDTQPMILEPPGGIGNSNGVLLVGDGGSRAVLMITDMDLPRHRQPYDVWLVRNGIRVPVGQVSVDSNGWGSMMLIPPEPVFQFEWVNLTMKDSGGTSPATETMVLRSRISPQDGGK